MRGAARCAHEGSPAALEGAAKWPRMVTESEAWSRTWGKRMQPPPLRVPVQWRSWRERPLGGNLDVVERRDAPDEALGMKVPENGLGIINVRFAGDPAVRRRQSLEVLERIVTDTPGTQALPFVSRQA
jgi:hypothetical protein